MVTWKLPTCCFAQMLTCSNSYMPTWQHAKMLNFKLLSISWHIWVFLSFLEYCWAFGYLNTWLRCSAEMLGWDAQLRCSAEMLIAIQHIAGWLRTRVSRVLFIKRSWTLSFFWVSHLSFDSPGTITELTYSESRPKIWVQRIIIRQNKKLTLIIAFTVPAALPSFWLLGWNIFYLQYLSPRVLFFKKNFWAHITTLNCIKVAFRMIS